MGEYIDFTKEQLIRDNSTDLVEFLRRYGQRLKPCGREYRWVYSDSSGEHDSISINGNSWYDFKNECGGRSIAFAREKLGLTFQDAVLELLGSHAAVITMPSREQKQKQKSGFKLPPKNETMRRLFAYLTKERKLKPDVIEQFIHEGKLYEDAEHHNIVFVGLDEQGTARSAAKKGTCTFVDSYRRNVLGSDVRYSFDHIGNSKRLYVFEAPIDMMSYIQLFPQNWKENSYIALNGVSKHALTHFISSHDYIAEIVLCLDNDIGGIDASDRLTDVLREIEFHGIVARHLSKNKDWNEDIKEQCGITPKPAVPHPMPKQYRIAADRLRYLNIFNHSNAAAQIQVFYNQQDYIRAAGCALSACAKDQKIHFDKDKAVQDCFKECREKLVRGYQPYKDRMGTAYKRRDTEAAFNAVIKGLYNTMPKTMVQVRQGMQDLMEFADKAIRLHMAEQEMEQSESLSPTLEGGIT